MTEQAWQVSSSAAEVYESRFVPAIFRDWAPRIVEAAGIKPRERVLDVACGTGVVARHCRERGAEVVGIDLNEGMLAVARRTAPDIEWRQGDAGNMPFDDETFDAVVCQFGLMFFPRQKEALREQWRVLAPGGRLVVSTWNAIEQSGVYATMAELTERHGSAQAASAFRAPFSLGNASLLSDLFRDADITDFTISTHEGKEHYQSVDEYVEIQIKASPLAEFFDEDNYAALLNDARKKLSRYRKSPDVFEFTTQAHIVNAIKPYNS